jgi:hypothetical protein
VSSHDQLVDISSSCLALLSSLSPPLARLLAGDALLGDKSVWRFSAMIFPYEKLYGTVEYLFVDAKTRGWKNFRFASLLERMVQGPRLDSHPRVLIIGNKWSLQFSNRLIQSAPQMMGLWKFIFYFSQNVVTYISVYRITLELGAGCLYMDLFSKGFPN